MAWAVFLYIFCQRPVLCVLKPWEHTRDGCLHVRILYIESCSIVAASVIKTIKRALRRIAILLALADTLSRSWDDVLWHLCGEWNILFDMDVELLPKFRMAYIKELELDVNDRICQKPNCGRDKKSKKKKKHDDFLKPRFVHTSLSWPARVTYSLGEPARIPLPG